MSKIVFFSIPAYGHTNPTLQVIRELTLNGHEVWYYSFNEFKEAIEGIGARFIGCDEYLPKLTLSIEKKIGKDFSALIEMVVDTTLALQDKVLRELEEIKPDCIISDSMCIWGKLFANRMNIKYISSTTTFAFNRHTAKMMKQSIREVLKMVFGMGKINKKLDLLRKAGYEVSNMLSLIENSNDTDTIVYTSKEFQPMVETFSDKYRFIGPSIDYGEKVKKDREKKQIYISLGTVNNKNIDFYQTCIDTLKATDFQVIMSVGDKTNIKDLGIIPDNFIVKNKVNQIEVLKNTDIFLTHCGMNSVNESLYCAVPMILWPYHSEQRMVARRVEELGAGIIINKITNIDIMNIINELVSNDNYKDNAEKISRSFKNAGGPKRAAEEIIKIIDI